MAALAVRREVVSNSARRERYAAPAPCMRPARWLDFWRLIWQLSGVKSRPRKFVLKSRQIGDKHVQAGAGFRFQRYRTSCREAAHRPEPWGSRIARFVATGGGPLTVGLRGHLDRLRVAVMMRRVVPAGGSGHRSMPPRNSGRFALQGAPGCRMTHQIRVMRPAKPDRGWSSSHLHRLACSIGSPRCWFSSSL